MKVILLVLFVVVVILLVYNLYMAIFIDGKIDELDLSDIDEKEVTK